MPSYIGDLIPNQIEQAWVRLAACLICGAYISVHNNDLGAHFMFLSGLAVLYIGLQIFVLISVKNYPLSFSRTVITPVFDIFFLTTALTIDGGQFSPLYLVYFAIIMGNGMRFGNRLLVFSQILSLLAFPSACLYLWAAHNTPIDVPVLVMQMLILLILPRYTNLANRKANDAIQAKVDAESMSFQLLDNSPLAAFTFQYDAQKSICIHYVNQALQKMSSLPLEALVGYHVQVMSASDDSKEIEHACKLVLENQQQDATFYMRSHGKDSTRQLLGHVRSFQASDATIGICFLTDITQQQQETLKMQQTMQDGYMGTLVAGIVHDFRNILTSIMGTAEVMQFSQTEPQTLEYLELIIQASEQGSRMITDLLTLGKASQSEEQEEEHDIMQVLTSMINLLRIQLPESIPLILHMPSSLPAVSIRLTQLEQILMNLIKNSAHASPDGGAIDVSIFTGMQSQPAETSTYAMMIQVSDHGVGIAEDDIDNVSKAFWTSHKDSGGTGLGLAMVQRIVRQHNGNFHIDSVVGKGTCITLTFPMLKDAPKDDASAIIAHAEGAAEVEPKVSIPSLGDESTQPNSHTICRVLLVDDNPDVLHVHQQMLERMQHHITLTRSGEEALAQFSQNPEAFDLIVTDFLMPGMDGMDLCAHIRQRDTQMPLLMITAYGENDKLQQADKLNIQILSKPIAFQELKKKIQMLTR